MGWMPDVRGARGSCRQAADGQDPAAAGQVFEERPGGGHFVPRGRPVRARRARVRRHDVPAESLELQLCKDPPDNRGARLGRATPRQLALRGEGNAGDPRAPVAGGFPDQEHGRSGIGLEVLEEPSALDIRALALPVEVERPPDPSRGEALNKQLSPHAVTMLMHVRGRIAALVAVCAGVWIPAVHASPPQGFQSSESDLHVDPTNPAHLIGVSKWVVNSEGYNHLAGFFESFDTGATWPTQGHIPGYEGWTDNSDPVGAFDPWGNFYAIVLPYMFDYTSSGTHRFLSSAVNPRLARSGIGVTVRPHGAATANAWLTTYAGGLDLVAGSPFQGAEVFDKQWVAIDTNRRSRFFGRVYVAWSIGGSDQSLRIYESHADGRPDGTHGNWSAPKLVLRQVQGIGENGPLPRVTPDGTVWLAVTSFSDSGRPFTISVTSSRNGGSSWTARQFVRRGQRVRGYANTTFRAAFGLAFEVGKRKVGRAYPLYAAYEDATASGTAVFLTASFDNGRHWHARLQVNDNGGAGEALQPGVAVAPNGRVAVAFYDRRLPCPGRASPEAAQAGLQFDPRGPFGRLNYCINTAVQFYGAGLRPLGHNIRLSAQTWDPQLSAPHPGCICSAGTFIGDYFGVDSRGGFTYTAAVTTANAADRA